MFARIRRGVYFFDRFGRRLPITTGLVVTALALAGYAFADNEWQLLGVRALHGIAAAVLTPGAFAMLGDSTQQGQRARRMGRSAAGIAIAAVVGPASAGILADGSAMSGFPHCRRADGGTAVVMWLGHEAWGRHARRKILRSSTGEGVVGDAWAWVLPLQYSWP